MIPRCRGASVGISVSGYHSRLAEGSERLAGGTRPTKATETSASPGWRRLSPNAPTWSTAATTVPSVARATRDAASLRDSSPRGASHGTVHRSRERESATFPRRTASPLSGPVRRTTSTDRVAWRAADRVTEMGRSRITPRFSSKTISGSRASQGRPFPARRTGPGSYSEPAYRAPTDTPINPLPVDRSLLADVHVFFEPGLEQKRLHVTREKRARLWVHHVQSVMVDQHRLLLEPQRPALLADLGGDAPADDARERRTLECRPEVAAVRASQIRQVSPRDQRSRSQPAGVVHLGQAHELKQANIQPADVDLVPLCLELG